MCICINCYYYKFCYLRIKVENLNEESIFKKNPVFFRNLITPKFATLNLNLFKTKLSNEVEFDLVECDSFLESPKIWLLLNKKT